jgi:hypothetical protein
MPDTQRAAEEVYMHHAVRCTNHKAAPEARLSSVVTDPFQAWLCCPAVHQQHCTAAFLAASELQQSYMLLRVLKKYKDYKLAASCNKKKAITMDDLMSSKPCTAGCASTAATATSRMSCPLLLSGAQGGQ